MDEEQRSKITLGALATILGSTFLFNLVIYLLWFIVVLYIPDRIYAINENWFAITRHEFDLVNYCGIAFMKIINTVFFLFPYLAIKLYLRKKKSLSEAHISP
jgi:hypothetical protein